MYFYTTALVLLGNCGAENSSRHPFFTCLKFLTLGKNELGDRKQRGAHCTAVSGIFRVISPLWMLTGKVYLPPNEEPVFFFFFLMNFVMYIISQINVQSDMSSKLQNRLQAS